MNLTRRVEISHRIALLSYAALLAAIITDWLSGGLTWSRMDLLLIQTLPLLIFLPGLLRRHAMVYLWMNFVLLLYIIKSVLDLSLGLAPVFAGIKTVASLTLFIAALGFVRYNRLKLLEQHTSHKAR